VASDLRGAEVALDATGHRLLAYTQWDGTRDVLSARRYVPGNGWGPAERIDMVGQSHFPRIVVDPGGRALVVWAQLQPPAFTIWANRFEGGPAR